MKVLQAKIISAADLSEFKSNLNNTSFRPLVLAFGSTETCEGNLVNAVVETLSQADVIFCSTSGHFLDQHISDEGLYLTALQFEKTRHRIAIENISNAQESEQTGVKLAEALIAPDLKHVLVFSDGLSVNGTALANGLTSVLGQRVIISGGLAGDGSRFQKTLVGVNKSPRSGQIAVVGFYSQNLETAAASMGGWDAFGPKRMITKSTANVLWQLDGKPALQVYKEYLGKHAAELPASALLFPLALATKPGEQPVVRTILSIDENTGAMTFAGDLPQDSEVQLMKSNIDRLVAGAEGAAEKCTLMGDAEFALLVSCVGRRLVMGQRTEEEIEAVENIARCALTGFYSYGELSPQTKADKCSLHNQTMTVTLFRETP